MIKTISFIGSGRVATHLAIALAEHFDIHQIMSRNVEHAQNLANKVAACAITNFDELKHVDLLIIAVSDNEIKLVAENLKNIGYANLVVHTSGSTDLKVLSGLELNSGVLYPLQTFSFEHQVDWKSTPLFIEATLQDNQQQLMAVVKSLSQRCYEYTSEQRLSLHLAAVFACNFTNHCYDIAQQILSNKAVDFELLMPLITSTTHKLHQTSAFENQTGPARRDDTNILNMHQEMLSDQPKWEEIYRLMSESIQKRFQN